MKAICRILLLIIACSPFTAQDMTAQFQVYFVAVGSGWYASPSAGDVHGFSRIRGANRSAEIVAKALSAGGAKYGIELTAGDQSFVTVSDMEKSLRTVASRIAAEKPASPLFVFYIASHGISEGIAWSHFSIPGDFVYRGDPSHLNIEGLSNSTLYAGSLVDELEKLRIPFLVLLDSCRDGEEQHFSPSVLSPEATRNLNDVGNALRVMNEFRDSYPVLFSTTPGQSVETVTDPLAPEGPQAIGPLARRFSLSTSNSLNTGSAITLNSFLRQMTSPTLDKLTSPAVTHSGVRNEGNSIFLLRTSAPHSFDIVEGTGAQAHICCSTAVASTPTSPSKSFSSKGTLSFAGAAGEFISSGKHLNLSDPACKISVTQQGPGDIQITFEHGDTEYDANFSTGSNQRFGAGTYAHAQRYGMDDSGQPGLEISGDGRSCNEISGSFQAAGVEYRSDGTISRFAATFEQLCDDSKVPLRGSISISSQ
jgi:hypothetical protein